MKIKNYFLSTFALTSMLLATSCSQDELGNEPATGDYVTAKFTIETPTGINSRAIGDGTSANIVECAVFDAEGNEIAGLRDHVTVTGKKATYSTRLVKGQAYRVAFFAYNNQGESYYDVTDMKNIRVKEAEANIEARDAFTNYIDIAANKTLTAIEETVTLYRPFAQLNIGAYKADIDAAAKAGIVVEKSTVTVSNVYTVFSAYDDAIPADAEATTVTFSRKEIPSEDLLIDINSDGNITEDEHFTYLALNYLLIGDRADAGTANAGEKSLTDVTFEWKTADGKTNDPVATFKNVPVQRNYRTNIIGNILTNPAVFNIVIDERFEKPDYIVKVWDGAEVTQPEEENNEIIITTAAEWAYLVANGANDKNIKLGADIDFGGNTVDNFSFAGEFDGQGHIMSNMTLAPQGSNYSNGLFQGDALPGDVTIKNVTIENVNVDSKDPGQGYAGVIFGDIQNNRTVTLEGVKVENANVKGVQSVGGLVGLVASGCTLNVRNCSVDGSKISNYAVDNESGNTAGLVGRPVGTVNVENSTVTNTTIDAYYAPRRGEASIQPVVAYDATLAGGAGTVVTKTCYVASDGTFAEALKLDEETLNITLGANVNDPEGVWGGASTKAINIEGNKKTLNIKSQVKTANNASLAISDATLTNGRGNGNAWYQHINFCVPVELTNVTTNEVTFQSAATLKGVTINVNPNTNSDSYAMWVCATAGQKVDIDGLNINAKGVNNFKNRAIKISDEYVTGDITKVIMSVKNATFASDKKSAILVGSIEGADITLGEGINIINAGNTQNVVTVDSDYAQYAAKVTVNGQQAPGE